MAITVAKIRDANVYVEGTSTHGQAGEITLPDVAAAKSDYKALGMVGTMELFNGFDKMEATIKWNSPSDNIMIGCADPRKSVNLMICSSREVYEAGSIKGEEPVRYFLKGTSKNFNLGSLKAKEDSETETKFSVSYVKMVQNGIDIYELDVNNNIFKVGGVDLMAKYRENLGV